MLPFLLPCPADAGIAARFAYLANAVMVYVAARVKHAPSDWHGVLIPLALANLINGWIMNRRNRIVALMARIAAGTQRKPLPYKPRAVTADATTPPPQRRAPAFRPPALLGWLCPLAQEVNAYGIGLAMLVGEAEMKAMVLAHPRLAKLIRPLLKMLGAETPAWFPAAPKRPATDQAKRTRAPTIRRRATPATQADVERDDSSHRLAVFVETVRARQYAAAVAMGVPVPVRAETADALPDPGMEWRRAIWRGKMVLIHRRRWGL